MVNRRRGRLGGTLGELLTIAEAAKRAGIPESTARFYRDRHSGFIPVIGEGRGRRYPVEAVDVLRTITEAARRGDTPDMIDAALSDLVRQAVREETNEIMAELVELRAEVARLTAALSAGQQQDAQQNATPTEASEPPADVDQVSRPTPARPWWQRLGEWIAGRRDT